MARPISGSPSVRGRLGAASGRGASQPPLPGGTRRAPAPGGRGSLPGANVLVAVVAFAGVGLLVGAALFVGGGPGPTPGPTGSAAPSAAAGGAATPSPAIPAESAAPSISPEPAGPADVDLALVADVREPRVGLGGAALVKAIKAGRVAVSCGVETLSLDGATIPFDASACLEPSAVVSAVRASKPRYGLLPASLVTPRVKVLRIGDADLFGAPTVRERAYPLAATAAADVSWSAFDRADIRTLISTGDTCPDRGVSHQANTLGKGWDWVLNGGTAEYTGIGVDRRFDGPDGNGWPVVYPKRTGNRGAVRSLVSDAEITLNDFECPMTASFTQHDTGTVFSIDPAVAPALADAGVDVVTLASNHMTDQGTGALKETLRFFKDSGIKTFGAGMNLKQALKPAVVDVRGVRFAFVGFNEIPGSARAGASTAGVAYLDEKNVRAGIAAAREVADVVIVVPQWGWPEYHANFTARQKEQIKLFWDAGADHVVGHGTHWAAAISLTKGDTGHRFVISSHGNFLFGQDWSRQTQEAVVVELTFTGTTLAQARLHPYVVVDQAQPNLTDPTTDGAYVLDQVWSVSKLR